MEVEIKFNGITLLLEGTYEEEEGSIMYDEDLAGYPGSSSSFAITQITLEDSNIDIYELFSEDDLEEIIELAIIEIESNG